MGYILKFIAFFIGVIAISAAGIILTEKHKRNMWEDYNNADDDYELYKRREEHKNKMD